MSIAQVQSLPSVSLATLNQGTGSKQNSRIALGVMLVSILEFFGAEWNDSQCEDVTDILNSEYCWITFAEIKLFSLQAKMGKFNVKGWKKNDGDLDEWDGKIYGKFAPMNFIKWIERFAIDLNFERSKAFLEKNVIKSDRDLPKTDRDLIPEKDLVSSERISESFGDLIKKMTEHQNQEAQRIRDLRAKEFAEKHKIKVSKDRERYERMSKIDKEMEDFLRD